MFFQIPRVDDGLEAIVFTAQGDMRQVMVITTLLERSWVLFYDKRLFHSWYSYAHLWSADPTCYFPYQSCVIQALNNLQSTYAGFGYVNAENVFKVYTVTVLTTMKGGGKVVLYVMTGLHFESSGLCFHCTKYYDRYTQNVSPPHAGHHLDQRFCPL